MVQRLRFIVDGDDNLSRVLNHAGDSSARLHRRLNDDMNANSRAVHGFVQSADGRLRDLRGRFLSVEEAQRRMAAGIPVVNGRLGDLSDAGSNAASSLGSSGGGLTPALYGVAGVLGTSLLPAIGALVPMMAGAGLAAGTLKLGFAGVGKAMDLAGKDQKKYAEALKKMSPEQRDFTKSLVSLKKEFGGIGKDIQKAMLPGFTKALKDAAPVVKIVSKSMVDMGKSFGNAAQGVGKLLKDSGFQKDLQTNLKLGAGFIKDMTTAVGPFVRSLLDLGAASGPTLKALSDGLSGLLTKGLPGMFDGLKSGIPGTAKMLDGLFSAVNNILPALGRLSGEFGKTLGPLFGEAFKVNGGVLAGAMDTVRGALVLLRPVFRDVMFMFKNYVDFAKIVGPTLRDTGAAILDAFLPLGSKINETATPMQRINNLIRDNKGVILEAARVFGGAMIDMTGAAIQAAPAIIHVFRLVSEGVLTALDAIVSGAAKAFGWVPGIGGKLKAANKAFDSFKDGYLHALDTAEKKASDFAASTAPKLAQGKLRMNINNWQQQIDTAKAKLKTVPPEKRAALKATIADLLAKVRAARAELASVHDKHIVLTTEKRTIYTGQGGRGPNAYAAGGTPKAGELAMVGEQGPELVVFGQAARVFDAKKTRNILTDTVGGSRGSGQGLASVTGGAGAAAGQGLAAGMSGSLALVTAAARRMADGVTSGIKAELQIASPSKKTKALAYDVAHGFLEGLTRSREGIKAKAADLVKDIKTAFSGKKENSLIRMVDSQTKRLLDAAAKRDKIAAKIAEAKAFATSVAGTSKESAGLSNLGMDPDQVTAGGIKAGLAQKLSQIKQFTSYIKKLAERGLNKTLLKQILNMGPDAGYAYASALVGADQSTFKSINSLQSQINESSDVLGRVGADRLYDSGKNASKGFLAGLQSQQKDIEKLMMSIAKSMEKSIKKALGIKSPSTVMAQLGAYSTQGLARGLLDGMPDVDRALDTVSGRVAGTRPVIGRPAATGRGGGQVVHLTVQFQGLVTDRIGTAKEIVKVLNELARTTGQTVTLGVSA